MPQICRDSWRSKLSPHLPLPCGTQSEGWAKAPQTPRQVSNIALYLGAPCVPTQRAQRWGLSGIRAGHTSLCQEEAAVYSLARSFVTMNLKPTDKTALPVVLWEAHILGEQGGHLLVSCLLPWGNWNNILLKYLSRRFCCIFFWRHKKISNNLVHNLKNGSQVFA